MHRSLEQQVRIIAAIVSVREEATLSYTRLSIRRGGSATLIQKIEAIARGVVVAMVMKLACLTEQLCLQSSGLR